MIYKSYIPMENINMPNGSAVNIEECLRHEKEIRFSGGIDIQFYQDVTVIIDKAAASNL